MTHVDEAGAKQIDTGFGANWDKLIENIRQKYGAEVDNGGDKEVGKGKGKGKRKGKRKQS